MKTLKFILFFIVFCYFSDSKILFQSNLRSINAARLMLESKTTSSLITVTSSSSLCTDSSLSSDGISTTPESLLSSSPSSFSFNCHSHLPQLLTCHCLSSTTLSSLEALGPWREDLSLHALTQIPRKHLSCL